VPGWKTLTDAIHFWGAKAAVQINLPGGGVDPLVWPGVEPATPSAAVLPGYLGKPVLTRELRLDEILWLEDQFVLGANCAREAGFDVIALHCVHGYGISSFQSPYVNKRTDSYGGSFENRMRFGLNVLRKVKEVIAPDMAVTCRVPVDEFAPGSSDKAECICIARTYEDGGADAIQLSCGTVGFLNRIIQPFYYPRAYLEPYLAEMRKAIRVPLSIVGSFNDPEDAERMLRDYDIDFIDLGRSLIADPDYPKKVIEGRPEDIRRCLRCNASCIYGVVETHSGIDCTVNVEVGRERALKIVPAEKVKNVLVIGGGPGGLEAARVASMRGHNVTLCEKSDRLGGALVPASVPDFKLELRWLIEWFSAQLGKLGVEVQLRKAVTATEVNQIKPDAVIVATGAEPFVPDDVVGVEKAIPVLDVLLGNRGVREPIIMVGGGPVGCDTALHLAKNGKNVLIVEALGELARDENRVTNFRTLLGELEENNVTWVTNTRVTEIHDGGIKAIDMVSGKSLGYQGNSVVLALGLKPVNELIRSLEGKVPEIYAIGDCIKPRRITEAIQEGSIVARRI
jgi:2,4-dienoyl-CoA reductase-like NADH-dependent reductase (Old Yellow Enzyme family)/thioredoxin reductase